MITLFRRLFGVASAILSLLVVLASASAGADTAKLPHGMTIDLPEGWELDGPEEGTLGKDGLRRLQLVCESEACRRTQETCTLLMREKRMEGADDAARLRSLYVSPVQRYVRLRAVLRATGRDAEILKPLELTEIGERAWYRVETDARHNFKSGLFAETVVSGLYVGAICKSCETGEVRHQDGRKILMSLQSAPTKSAAAPR